MTVTGLNGLRLHSLGVIFILLLILPSITVAEVKLVYPEPSSAVTQSRHLVFKLGNGDISAVVVTVNGVASDPLPVGTTEYKRAFKDFLILQPLWDKGKNQILVDTYSGEKKRESFKAEIFYAPKGDEVDIPKEFAGALLHRPENESLCAPCHNMRPTLKQVTDVPDKDNPCYSCHKRMANQKNVHTPVSMYSCVQCHPLQGNPRYAPVKRDAELCYDCHKDQQKEFRAFKYIHGPVAGGMCEVCHDPHASDYPAQLLQPVNKLCLSCHEQVTRGVHVIAVGDGSSHPIADKIDPSDRGKGRDLSCISCHDPHGGKVRYYLVTGVASKMDLCQMCHKK